MSLAYVVAKLFVNMFIYIYAGGHLGFRHFDHFLNIEKMPTLFVLIFMIFWVRTSEKSILTVEMGIFTHLKLCLADAIHNFMRVKIPIR